MTNPWFCAEVLLPGYVIWTMIRVLGFGDHFRIW
jgi:hypothetical protein